MQANPHLVLGRAEAVPDARILTGILFTPALLMVQAESVESRIITVNDFFRGPTTRGIRNFGLLSASAFSSLIKAIARGLGRLPSWLSLLQTYSTQAP
jgi:hypothetical protein